MAAGDVEVNVISPKGRACAVFDGIDDHVAIPHKDYQLGINLQNGMSFSAWVCPTAQSISNAGKIVDKSTSGSGSIDGFGFFVRNNSVVTFRINASTIIDSPINSAPPDVWTHVVVTVKYPNILNFYINGEHAGAADQLIDENIDAIVATNDMRIGLPSASALKPFDGGIADVRMWKRNLSASEALDVYQGTTVSKDLVGQWLLDVDYTDATGFNDGVNSGSKLAILDDAISTTVKANRTTANDVYLLCETANGRQAIVTTIEEAP